MNPEMGVPRKVKRRSKNKIKVKREKIIIKSRRENRKHGRSPAVVSLPGDLLIEVLGRVASSSFVDLFNAKLW